MPLELVRCTASQIESFSPERTVFFFPVGPLEDHGPHLPMGLDIFEAERLCKAFAEKLEAELPGWKGVIMPTAPLGVDTNTTYFGLVVRAHVLRDWLVDAALGLRRHGFQHFACVSGHLGPKQLTAIEEAGKLIARKNWFHLLRRCSLVSLSSSLVTGAEVKASPFWPDPVEHGGARDTSVALALDPSLVDPSGKHLPTVEREPLWVTRGLKRASHQVRGYWGAPKEASVERGQAEFKKIVERAFPRLKSHLSGVFSPSAFRSWYSIIPSNRSFFKSWILALAVLIAFAIFASLTFQIK